MKMARGEQSSGEAGNGEVEGASCFLRPLNGGRDIGRP